jgi:ABC-type phosphate transport system substrate-binding protein
VVPFAWVKSVTGSSLVTNVTIQQLQTFLSNGQLPLSYFTGRTNDDATLIYLVGRDSGSGTRITTEKDALFSSTPQLWAPDGSCNWSISAGFSSGSGLVTVLNGACGPALGYLGLSDAVNVASGANIISYNGFKPFNGAIGTPDFAPVRKGQYSLWCYEHLYKRTSSTANVTSFRTGLATEINTDLATSTTAIQTGTMQVTRNNDGGPIFP